MVPIMVDSSEICEDVNGANPYNSLLSCKVATRGPLFLRFEHWRIWKRKRNIGHFAGVKVWKIKLMIGWTEHK
jgi:hypothetical protein